jgi:hypothetical protein
MHPETRFRASIFRTKLPKSVSSDWLLRSAEVKPKHWLKSASKKILEQRFRAVQHWTVRIGRRTQFLEKPRAWPMALKTNSAPFARTVVAVEQPPFVSEDFGRYRVEFLDLFRTSSAAPLRRLNRCAFFGLLNWPCSRSTST